MSKFKVVHVDDIKFKMIRCSIGEFWMGSEINVMYKAETPRHQIKMNKEFLIGETQVIQELWHKVMGWNPSFFAEGGMFPVENVTWYDCLVFCNKLSELEGLRPCFTLTDIKNEKHHIVEANVEWYRDSNGYRLPTEAEWEYCAKAGTELTYSGSNEIDEVGWYRKLCSSNKQRRKTHKVKRKKPNAWGLYDMSGNVWEWCMDQRDDNAYRNRINENIENPILWNHSPCVRVIRGGSAPEPSYFCRVAYRACSEAYYRYEDIGFRLLRDE